MAVLLSFNSRLTSDNGGRPAKGAISSGSSYHFLPHFTKRTAPAITCARVASAFCAGAILAGCLDEGRPGAASTARRSVRVTCAVLTGGGARRFAAASWGLSRVVVGLSGAPRAAAGF